MSVFGLVHGGGFGAWCWDQVTRALQDRGHLAITVDLSPEDLGTGAAHCADVVVGALTRQRNLVLVGHSIAGLFIPLAADRLALGRLVFLHALLPRPGQSVVDQMASEPGMFNPEMLGTSVPFWEDESVAARFLLHDCHPEIARAAFGRLRPEPGVLGQEVTPLESWPRVPCAYILCADDRTLTPAWARRAARERLGVEPIEIAGGHCPMLSRPEQLAEVLSRCEPSGTQLTVADDTIGHRDRRHAGAPQESVELSVFIGTSLDGFIARENGALDWLHGDPGEEPPPDFGYQAFFDSVDALVMGRRTFEVVRTFPTWPYGSKPVVVLSHRPIPIPTELSPSVERMSGTPQEIVARLEARGWKHLYVDGGKTIQAFLAAGLIGRLIINRLPILLGSGIPLFGPLPGDLRMEHIRTRSYPGGMVQTEYRVIGAATR